MCVREPVNARVRRKARIVVDIINPKHPLDFCYNCGHRRKDHLVNPPHFCHKVHTGRVCSCGCFVEKEEQFL